MHFLILYEESKIIKWNNIKKDHGFVYIILYQLGIVLGNLMMYLEVGTDEFVMERE